MVSTQEIILTCNHCGKKLPRDHKGVCPYCGKSGKTASLTLGETLNVKDSIEKTLIKIIIKFREQRLLSKIIFTIATGILTWLIIQFGIIPIISFIQSLMTPKPDLVLYINRCYFIDDIPIGKEVGEFNNLFLLITNKLPRLIIQKIIIPLKEGAYIIGCDFEKNKEGYNYSYVLTLKNLGGGKSTKITINGVVDGMFQVNKSDPIVKECGGGETVTPFANPFYCEIPILNNEETARIILKSDKLSNITASCSEEKGNKCRVGIVDYKVIVTKRLPYSITPNNKKEVIIYDNRSNNSQDYVYNLTTESWQIMEGDTIIE